ncbi:MAG TPA: 2-oxoacid:acceptor oxidoreductase subunit alpha [Dehalococcoidia bacterium]|nr:2-oxoacid:acceptor oxidoreductase subunit alpha [Dehalococcoidia bacterium]
MTAPTQRRLDDVNLIVSGQGGDGSLTVSTILADLLRQHGLNVYTERDVLSRIKGGVAAAGLRASRSLRFGRGDQVDLIVSFDLEGIEKTVTQLAPDAVVVYDDSDVPIPADLLRDGVRLYTAPFARLAVRELGRILYKNSIAVAVATRLLGIADEEVQQGFEQRFARLGQAILDQNLQALDLGFELAAEMELSREGDAADAGGRPEDQLQITGNQATALGFIAGGGRFFAGYPITPATEIMDQLGEWLPRFGGVVWQAEDELASVNMVIGAALAGVRAMTATSGPGIALMQEGIGQAGSAEIPIVIVDSQRGGPSTGMPTKPEQSDLNMMAFGGNGDFPRIVLNPGDPGDCFELAVAALNLAERFQCPVYIALDQALSQNQATVAPFDIDDVTVDRGKRLSAEQLAAMPAYRRYAMSNDGVSEYSVAGTPGGMSLVSGNERDPFGHVSANPENRVRMVDKRAQKLETAKAELPRARRAGDPSAKVGLIGVGTAYGVLLETMELLEEGGVTAQLLQPRTVFPVLDETLAFVESCERVYVVEHNATGQLAGIIAHGGGDSKRMRKVLRYDGLPLRPNDIAEEILELESGS